MTNTRLLTYLILAAMTFVFNSYAPAADPPAKDEPKKNRDDEMTHPWFPGMVTPPRVTLALPKTFTVVSFSPDDEWNMTDGVIWADKETAAPYEKGRKKKMDDLKAPLFYVRLSSSIAQIGKTNQFTHEKEMEQGLAKSGIKNVKLRKLAWGDYPLLELTGTRPDGSVVRIVWVGLNTPGGWTLMIDYRLPIGEGHPSKEELAIWNDFIEKTKPEEKK